MKHRDQVIAVILGYLKYAVLPTVTSLYAYMAETSVYQVTTCQTVVGHMIKDGIIKVEDGVVKVLKESV